MGRAFAAATHASVGAAQWPHTSHRACQDGAKKTALQEALKAASGAEKRAAADAMAAWWCEELGEEVC
tara:strand:- start:92 stop:295 length:204 start_codon:yes stop_codon:yes gene_type:complete